MQQSIMETQDTTQLYNSAMQGLSSYANNIMGHTMNQYAAQSSLLTTQVHLILSKIILKIFFVVRHPPGANNFLSDLDNFN